MATLNINGRRVTVDDSFLSLSPEQQDATVNEIATSIGQTVAAQPGPSMPEGESWSPGQIEPAPSQGGLASAPTTGGMTARDVGIGDRLFDAAKAMGLPASQMRRDLQSLDAGVRGAADVATFGLADEIAAGMGSLTGVGGQQGEYSKNLELQRSVDREDARVNSGARLVGQMGGGIAQGALLAPISMGAQALRSGQGMGRVALGSAVDGAAVGAAHGAGGGEGMEDRLGKAGSGILAGGAVGAAAPIVTAGMSAVARPLVESVRSAIGVGNQSRANRAIAQAFERSGRTRDDVLADMSAASRDGQDMFMLADALGNPGQRMLAAEARLPGNSRQAIVDALEGRQAGQGRRVQSFLDDAFTTEQGTALQRQAAQTAERRSAANVNYGAARSEAGAVDTSAAIAALDDVVRPGVTPMTGAGATDGSVYSTLNRARSYLTDGRSQVSDFDRAFMAKTEMDAIIEQGGPAAAMLRPARDRLDDALAASSGPYSNARDTYRQQSQAIDAVDAGRNASQRGRSEDTIDAFRGLSSDAQTGFRAGYVDPLIAQAQGAATGVNKARPLINDAFADEFPVVALPGEGERLMRRLGRENTMFETRGAALGGSRTADNLADQADALDPSMLTNLLTGRWPTAMGQMAGALGNAATGRNQATREQITEMLLTRSPDQARMTLMQAIGQQQQSAERRALINALAAQGGGQAGARF